jgi:Spx/MgsR family transcriptional regulator
MLILYGIKQCDTVAKARRWLETNGRDYRFHDFRVDGLGRDLLERFERAVGWELLLNRRGTTWRQLPEPRRAEPDREGTLALMLEYPALIKRPVLDAGDRILVGFSPVSYGEL